MHRIDAAVISLIAIGVFAFMFRWDIEAGSGVDGNDVYKSVKLDRWTGTSYACDMANCVPLGMVMNP